MYSVQSGWSLLENFRFLNIVEKISQFHNNAFCLSHVDKTKFDLLAIKYHNMV